MLRARRLPSLALFVVIGASTAACATATPGWTYAPAPSVAPAPSAAASEPATESPSATSGGVSISASGVTFEQASVSAPAGQAFQITFDNKDAGIPHNVAIHVDNASGAEVFKGDIVTGPATTTYAVPALDAGTYVFVCTVHPNMTGTLSVQ
jgi:plastocyanin